MVCFFLQVNFLGNLIQAYGQLPSVCNQSVEEVTQAAEVTFVEVMGTSTETFEEHVDRDVEGTQKVDSLHFLKRGRPAPQQHDDALTTHLEKYFISSYKRLPKIQECKKYFAATIPHPTFNRSSEYVSQW